MEPAAFSELLCALPTLTDEQLAEVSDRVRALGAAVGAQSVATLTEDQSLLALAVGERLTGGRGGQLRYLSSAQQQRLRSGTEQWQDFLARHGLDGATRAARLGQFRRLAACVVAFLQARQIPVSLNTILCSDVAACVDHAFPGYAQSRMLAVAFRQANKIRG